MNIIRVAKALGIRYNVTFRVYDEVTGKLVNVFRGHNQATNLMLDGIARFLRGDSVLGQGQGLSDYVPQYISLGTMGLTSQEADGNGLPTGLETDYARHRPGYGADGYDENDNAGRSHLGLGPPFEKRGSDKTVDCELISASFPRSPISYRQIVPEYKAETAHTVDLILSAMVSTGALAQFREPGKDYIFITEAGLWSRRTYTEGNHDTGNGLLAGYRILPPDFDFCEEEAVNSPEEFRKHILCVRKNQVVQVIWKIQLGTLDAFGNITPKPCDCTCPDRFHGVYDENCPCHGNKAATPEEPEPGPDTGPSKIFSEGLLCCNKLTLGANCQLRVDEAHIGEKLAAAASDDADDGTHTAYVKGTKSDAHLCLYSALSEASIENNGGCYFEIPLLAKEGAKIKCSKKGGDGLCTAPWNQEPDLQKTCTEDGSKKCLFCGGIKPMESTMPVMGTMERETGSEDIAINVNGQENICVLTPQHAYLLTRKSGSEHLPPIDEEIDPDKVDQQLASVVSAEETNAFKNDAFANESEDIYTIEKVIPSSGEDYGAYGNICLNTVGGTAPVLFVCPGEYAVKNLVTAGNNAKIYFGQNDKRRECLCYVQDKVQLSHAPHIEDRSRRLNWVLYCASGKTGETEETEAAATVSVGSTARMTFCAPSGLIRVSGGDAVGWLRGSVYAKEIQLGDGVKMGIQET